MELRLKQMEIDFENGKSKISSQSAVFIELYKHNLMWLAYVIPLEIDMWI